MYLLKFHFSSCVGESFFRRLSYVRLFRVTVCRPVLPVNGEFNCRSSLSNECATVMPISPNSDWDGLETDCTRSTDRAKRAAALSAPFWSYLKKNKNLWTPTEGRERCCATFMGGTGR